MNPDLGHVTASGSVQGPAPAQTDPRADRDKVKALAAQFESILLAQMLQTMRSSMFEGGDDKSSAPLADALFTELTLAISRAGGVGFADSMLETLQQQTGVGMDAAPPVTPGASGLPLEPGAFGLPGRLSSGYGWRRDPIDLTSKFHRGLDIAMPAGQPIPAPQAGTVVFAGEQGSYGLTVVLDHGQGVTTRYAHLSAIDVAVGDAIAAGQAIGRAGATGRATGAHLHFEVLEAGKSVNPAEKLTTFPGWPVSIP